MKKILFPAALAVITLLTACGEASNEFHEGYFYPQYQGNVKPLYADQTTDTVRFYCTDSWTATTAGNWFNASLATDDTGFAYGQGKAIVLTFTPNRTGTVRTGQVEVTANFKNGNFGLYLQQYPWLNVEYPTLVPVQQEDGTVGVSCQLPLTANTTASLLRFTTYADGATLTTGADWVSLPDSIYPAGVHTPTFALLPNEGSEARKAELALTSNGVTTVITLLQHAKTEQ